MKKESKYFYILITADEYEFIKFVGDTIEDISKQSKFSWDCLQRAFLRNSLIGGRYRLLRVNGKNLEFNFEDYHDFCKTEGLKPGYSSSLRKFKEYCGDTYVAGL